MIDALDNPAPDELSRLADILDEAAALDSRYQMVQRGRELLGLPYLGEVPESATLGTRSTAWALTYHLETTTEEGRRRLHLVPHHESGGNTEPPRVNDVDEAVASVWSELLSLVTTSPARARLQHLLFERGGPARREMGVAAAASYLDASANWQRGMDQVDDAAACTRLSRAVGERDLEERSLARALEIAEHYLDTPERPAGIILRALEHVVGEPRCPDRVDEILERAAAECASPYQADNALSLTLQRARDNAARHAVWTRRVELFTRTAEAADSKILRASNLHEALTRAEKSGFADLRDRAAALLETVRDDDLEMIGFSALTRQYKEQFDTYVDGAIAGTNWAEALASFTRFGPLTGDPDQIRTIVEQQRTHAPLRALLPTQKLTPEGLPFWTATTEDERFEADRLEFETTLIMQWAHVMSRSLHVLPERYGLPSQQDLTAFLTTWPGIEAENASGIARALARYWTGDPEGAAYTLVPRLEQLARDLVRASSRGTYRLQRDHSPGQFPGLGALLPVVFDTYDVPESDERLLRALVAHPVGLNVRNLLLHGYVPDIGAPLVAVLLHATLRLGAVELKPAVEPDESVTPPDPTSETAADVGEAADPGKQAPTH